MNNKGGMAAEAKAMLIMSVTARPETRSPVAERSNVRIRMAAMLIRPRRFIEVWLPSGTK